MPATLHLMGREHFPGSPLRRKLLSRLRETLALIHVRHPIDRLDVVLFPTPNLVDARWFRGGICHSTHAVECCFNPNHPLFAARWEAELPPLVIHEVHHALRYRHAGPWTIGENIVLEGLAMEAEVSFGYSPLDYGPPPDSNVLPELVDRAIRTRHVPINPSAAREDYEWIWSRSPGATTANMYHIGAAIAQSALETLGLDAFQAVSLPYEEIFAAADQSLRGVLLPTASASTVVTS